MRSFPRRVNLVIFDLDGTLVDAYPAIADSVNFMLRKLHRPAQSLRVVKRAVGHGVDGLIRHFVEEDLAVEALAIFRAHHDTRLRQGLKLLPGTKTLLPFLKKQGCQLAIASNRPTRFCRIILEELGIDGYFDQVVCGDQVTLPKPAPDVLKRVLKVSGVKAADAIYVGDMTVDIQCGQRAGVFVVGVPTGSCTRREVEGAGPDMMIPRIGALRALFVSGKR